MSRQYNRRPLRERENVLACDVTDAIRNIVGPDERTLPIAISKADIVAELIKIAHTAEDGLVEKPRPLAWNSMATAIKNRLTNKSTFYDGYKGFEAESKLPVCPVTDFFFVEVYANGDTAACLDAMNDNEITQSLPKKASRVPIYNEQGKVAGYMRDPATQEEVQYGELSGIVVFPPGSTAQLLRRWLERRSSVSIGCLSRTVDAITHARPNTAATVTMRERAQAVPGVVRKALPRPKKS